MTESNPQMNQQIQCPHCGQTYAVRPEQWSQYAGRTINCTRCAQPFTVTGAGGVPAQPPPIMQPQQPAPGGMGGSAPPYGYPPQAPGQQQPAYGYQTVYYPQSAPASGWAITSLIFGILSFCVPLGNIVAIITGIVGLVKTRNPRVGGKGLSIAGLCLGAFHLIIITPLVLAILLPALNAAREQANRVKCASNMRLLGQAMAMYANNNNGEFPDKLEKLLTADPSLPRTAFVCPDDSKSPPSSNNATAAQQIASGSNSSYIYVGNGVNATAGEDTVLLFEPLSLHHASSHGHGGMNVLFADGHVEWESGSEAQSILDQKAAGTRPIKVTTGP